jgi:hypothetical protein
MAAPPMAWGRFTAGRHLGARSARASRAAFLLPFVAIRVVAGDRQSGALKLELQQPMPVFWRVGAKALVLMAGWLIASVPTVAAVILWRSYGGSVYAPELATVAAGHVLNAGLTIALASAGRIAHGSSVHRRDRDARHHVGTWIINFIAAVNGGLWERAASYTPTAMVAEFQHGLVRLDVVIIAMAFVLAGLALAAIWMRLGVPVRRRVNESVALGALTAATVFACTFATSSWDTSESRANSLPEADEQALEQIRAPLRLEVHLAPEDPRRFDLEHRALNKLRRVMPKMQVSYVSATSIGLFEQTSAHYGEIWYDLGGRRAMSRMITAEGVLETIYSIAGVTPPTESDEGIFRGHPLAVPPKGAATVFYGIWPALVVAGGFLVRRRQA